jgi:hypothetical protein
LGAVTKCIDIAIAVRLSRFYRSVEISERLAAVIGDNGQARSGFAD